MSDYREGDIENRSRRDMDRGGGYSRNSNSIFNYGDRERRDDWPRERSRRVRDDDREARYRNRERGDRGRENYGRDDRHEGLPLDETSRLIASNKVEGTAVYGSDERRLGSVYNFMVDKVSGRVEYAVMSYGGFLGMGQRYYPLPWRILTYDTRLGGYRVGMAERDLRDAPSFDRQTEPRFDRHYGEQVNGWYGLDY